MGDIPPNPTHHPLPPNPSLGDTAGRRSPARQMDPPDAGREGDPREEFPRGFTRGGFAPIPHRHPDVSSASLEEPERQRSPPPPPRDYDRARELPRRPEGRERDYSRRDMEYDPDMERERRSWDNYYDRSRGQPPPQGHWEEDYGRPKRRRSPSPYDPAGRARHRSPSPPRFNPNPAFNFPDPAEIDYCLNYRQFADWFRASHPQTAKSDDEEMKRVRAEIEQGAPDVGKEKVGMAKRYDRYRKEYHSRQLFTLYLTHGQSAWFQERYSAEPRFQAIRKRVNRQGRVPTIEKYVSQLRDGKWDQVTFEDNESLRKATVSGVKTGTDEPEGLDRPLGEQHGQEDATRIEIAPEGKQVFVKTVPPSTRRVDLEELFASVEGFQHLAITEPSLRKQFHRVAWAQYTDETDLEEVVRKLDGSKIDTFIFHLGINASAVAGRLRFTPAIANSTQRLEHDASQAKALALKLEDELVDSEQEGDTTNGEAKAESGLDKPVRSLAERGSRVVEETISRLIEVAGLDKEGLAEDERNKKAKIAADQWIAYLRHGLSTCYYCVAVAPFQEELHRKCIGHARPDTSTYTHTEAVAQPEETKPTAEGGDDETEARHAEDREFKPIAKVKFPQKTGDERWEENLDAKIKPLIGEYDLAEYGGRDLQEEAKKITAPHIRQEEPTKYRCKECNKLFRAPEFVVKHVSSKHPEVIGDKLDNIPMFNNFVLDPQHIAPSANTPAAINDALPIPQNIGPVGFDQPGHFNPNMPMSDGTDGGMNMMQQQMMMMLQMQQAMMMGQMQFSPQQQNANLDGAGGQGGRPGQAAGRDLLKRVGGYASRDADLGPLPAAPPGGEDPRARRGRVSYQDLDEPGGAGDGGLPY